MPAVTPCVHICQLDVATGLCIGCARTSEEIALWASLSDPERQMIMAQLPERHALIRTPKSRCSPLKRKQ
jgi:uncharacterized protein